MRRAAVAGVAVAGAALLARSLSARPGSADFYRSTLAATALWTAGGLALGGGGRPDPRAVPVAAALGVAAFGGCYGCALAARRVPVLDRAVRGALRYAERGSTPAVAATALAAGAAEEVFFRGAVYRVAGDRPVLASTGVYTLNTLATGNPALVLASAVMGAFWGLQRRVTGGVTAPLVTHVVWSALMLRYLPSIFGSGPEPRPRLPGGGG